jgi:DNA polymerase IV
MDAFYASVEVRDRPQLRGKPVAVAWGGQRSVVCAASYEARRFGIRSAMPLVRAQRKCPELVVVEPRMDVYAEISRGLRGIYQAYTERVEPLALDECYLELTDAVPQMGPAGSLVMKIRREIRQQFGLPASAGVGPNKYVAKVASGAAKPDGQVVLRPDEVCGFLWPLSVDKLWGVGPVTAERLKRQGLVTIEQVAQQSPEQLHALLGKLGPELHELAWGRDNRPVETEWVAKSLSAEHTFGRDERDYGTLCEIIRGQAERLQERLRKRQLLAHAVVLKLRWPDFKSETRTVRLGKATDDGESIAEAALPLLGQRLEEVGQAVRLIGLAVSDLSSAAAPQQLELF